MVKKNSGMAVASFVLGLCSLLLFWTFVVPILAIVFGIIGLNQIKKDKNLEGKAMALWGICLGAVTPILIIFVGILWVVVKGVVA